MNNLNIGQFHATWHAGDLKALLKALVTVGLAPRIGGRIAIDHRKSKGQSLDEALTNTRDELEYFDHLHVVSLVLRNHALTTQCQPFEFTPETVLERLVDVDFEFSIFGEPFHDESPSYFIRPGHNSLGWGFALRGAGYQVLVSRNWLRALPARVMQNGDTTLVQFHAFGIAPELAAAQAEAGRSMLDRRSDESGVISPDFFANIQRKHEVFDGVVDRETRTMTITVANREVSNRELKNYAALRVQKPWMPHVDEIAYVFEHENQARAELARIWRYGHQVWAIRNGERVRLDLDYQPPDMTPDWART